MKRSGNIAQGISKIQGRRKALNLPVSTVPTKITDTTLYLAARVDGGSNIMKLTNDETKKQPGITNFDGNKLADGRDAVIDAIKVSCARGGVALNNVDWLGDNIQLPKELANAELKLVQSNVILLSLPLSDLVLSNDDDNYRDISSAPLLSSKDPIEWILEFAEGVTLAAEALQGTFIKIECRATQAIQ